MEKGVGKNASIFPNKKGRLSLNGQMISKLTNKSCLKIWLFGLRTQTVFSIIVSWLLAGAVMQAGVL